jgi:hypothetical protein
MQTDDIKISITGLIECARNRDFNFLSLTSTQDTPLDLPHTLPDTQHRKYRQYLV